MPASRGGTDARLITATTEEWARIDAAAKAAGESRAAFVRSAALERAAVDLGGILVPEEVAPALREAASSRGMAPEVLLALWISALVNGAAMRPQPPKRTRAKR